MKKKDKNSSKGIIKAQQEKAVKLQTYDLNLFVGQSYFVNDGAQNDLTFQPLYYLLNKLYGAEKLYHET